MANSFYNHYAGERCGCLSGSEGVLKHPSSSVNKKAVASVRQSAAAFALTFRRRCCCVRLAQIKQKSPERDLSRDPLEGHHKMNTLKREDRSGTKGKSPNADCVRTQSGGKTGIRTLVRLSTVTRFPVVRLRPAQPSFHMFTNR